MEISFRSLELANKVKSPKTESDTEDDQKKTGTVGFMLFSCKEVDNVEPFGCGYMISLSGDTEHKARKELLKSITKDSTGKLWELSYKYNRTHEFDAERKMIVYLNYYYKPYPNLLWKIFLYSEKAFCGSCTKIINRFILSLVSPSRPYYNKSNSIVALDGAGNVWSKDTVHPKFE